MRAHIRAANVARPICEYLVGKRHHPYTRLGVGSVIIIVGVCVAKAAHALTFPPAIILVDAVGYALHGLGLTPFVEHMVAFVQDGEAELHPDKD